MADLLVNRQAEHFLLLSSHPYFRSHFELSFCFITLFLFLLPILQPFGNSRFGKFCFQEPGRLPLHCYEDRSVFT
uniref:Uncharacterized protein n=1 Tax=Amphimedon queenslandica TaxID=400682 RepID=A0A1X7T3Q7_AMPQE